MVKDTKKRAVRVLALAQWALVAIAMVVAVTACGGEPEASEDCTLAGDEDGNGMADCADPACASVATCAVCGNGAREADEGCDDGNRASGDGCDSNCTVTACGNAVQTMNEGCDDGNGLDGDGCDSNCMVTGCGNGIRSGTEECDDGNRTSGDGCDNNCRATACGNGVRTASEGCDDGNQASGDGCDANCTVTACGNGVRTAGEACDDGNLTSDDGCDANCTATACGNGVRTAGEGCDDGNLTSGDGCDANCTVTACGNGVRTGSEACDDGNQASGDGCDSNCTVTACGNGVRTGAEACDDGNPTSGDGCDANCTVTACGNGIRTGSEACDDGNLTNGDGCDNNCTATGCGNGVVTTGEICDDGNVASGDGCDANCTYTRCGNGVITAGEECDDGNGNNTDGCTNACIIQVCGDNEVDAPETCDDGNVTSGDGCDANCSPTGCGNGVITAGEACDDGNLIAWDGCSPACATEPLELEPNEDGSISTGGSGITGNDFATANANANGALTGSITFGAALTPAGDEDVFLFRNTSSAPQLVRFDLWSRALGVGVSCGTSIDTGLQIRDAAGASLASNDNRAAGDSCSGLVHGLLPDASVYAHVMELGDNAPIAGYVLQAVYTPVPCGNGLIEFGEQCDDGNTAGGDGCGATCQIEVVCGDGLIAPGEQCDDGNAAGGDGCSATCQIETTAELEPNDTFAEAAASPIQLAGDRVIRGAIATATDLDTYRLVVSAATVIRFEAFTSIFDCNAAVALRLYDAIGTQILADISGLGVSVCSAIVLFVTPGTYYIRAESRFQAQAIPNYYLAVDYQIDRGAEAEPGSTSGSNDTTSTASANLVGGRDVFVFGDHKLIGDVDVYAITVPGGARVRAEIIEGDRPIETCEAGGIASRLTLFNQALLQVADDTSSGRGACSLIDGTGSTPLHSGARNDTTAPQTFYLIVQSATADPNGAVFIYRLQISFR
ncbi:MAG TPA: DUF4215 domain-containing protein [Kofleriaceae bacterium]|nr:DUF4215 domain-containing protein [Kofleriaceae bacterium]